MAEETATDSTPRQSQRETPYLVCVRAHAAPDFVGQAREALIERNPRARSGVLQSAETVSHISTPGIVTKVDGEPEGLTTPFERGSSPMRSAGYLTLAPSKQMGGEGQL